MHDDRRLSRRAVVGGLAVVPTVSASAVAAEPVLVDVELVALGRQLDSISVALDHANDHDEAMVLLDKIDTLSAAITATPARTLRGLLYVKARATAWALEGDVDLTKESSFNNRVAASIVRDLLQFGAAEA